MPHPLRRLLSASFAGLALAACATHLAPRTSPETIRMIAKNAEGQDHLALPTELEGCEFLGHVRASKPAGCEAGCDLVSRLKAKAAKKGGDTLVVLPGGAMVARDSGRADFVPALRVDNGSVRGTVFRCR